MDIERLNLDWIKNNLLVEEKKKNMFLYVFKFIISNWAVLVFNIFILAIFLFSLTTIESFNDFIFYFIMYLLMFSVFNIVFNAKEISDINNKMENNKINNLLKYLEKEYAIKSIPNYFDLEKLEKDNKMFFYIFKNENKYNNNFFDLNKLVKEDFIKNDDLTYWHKPFLTFDDDDFSANCLYLYTLSSWRYKKIYDCSIITRIKLKKSLNLNFIIKDNVVDWLKTNINYLFKFIIKSVFSFWIVFFILFFWKGEWEKINYEERLSIILNFKEYILITLGLFILIWIIYYIINYIKIRDKTIKININNLDYKYDVFILKWDKEIWEQWKSIITFFDEYALLSENKWKVLNFFVDNEYLYIKYDLLKSWKDLILIEDYVMEFKNHILFAKKFVKSFNIFK